MNASDHCLNSNQSITHTKSIQSVFKLQLIVKKYISCLMCVLCGQRKMGRKVANKGEIGKNREIHTTISIARASAICECICVRMDIINSDAI